MENKLRITNEQIDKLKTLESLEEFQVEVNNFRKKFSIEITKDSFNPKTPSIKPESLNELLSSLEEIGKNFNLQKSVVDYQLLFYIHHNKCGFDSSIPKEFLEPAIRAPINYQIINTPVARMGKDGKMIEYSKTASIVTHARLSTKEEKMALKDLREIQNMCFDPELTKQVRQKKSIERDISIEKEMTTREHKHQEEQLSGYLKMAKKEFDKGLRTSQKFSAIKKLHPKDIEIIQKGKTSKDIAQTTLGDKKYASKVRQIASRIRRKKKIFKKKL